MGRVLLPGARDGLPAPLLRMLGHTTVVLVLLTSAYFLLPLRFDRDEPWTLPQLAGSLLALAAVSVLLRRELRRSRRSQSDRYLRIQWLLSALYLLVLTFALGYAVLAEVGSDQLEGLETRTDALYFSVTVVSTVGFGDIHAEGTAARLVVTAHMLFNLVYLGTALRLLTGDAARGLPEEDRAQQGEQER